MTGIPIKDIPGALMENKKGILANPKYPSHKPGYNPINEGFNLALTQQGEVKIGLNSDKLDSIIHQIREEFGVNNYEVRGDSGNYTPNEQEKFLMEDMLEGFIYELKKSIIAKQKDLFEVVE